MKTQIIIASLVVAITSIAFAQVDTMRLLEVGSVTAPGAITNWYFEDMNGDSIKEIILTTANSVNIYSGQSFLPIWSQDGFTNPKDLNFADINNDGLIDFSVKDTSRIYLIDPHHSTTIWTSPMLDSTYKCYTIGDRNDDGWVDMAIATNPNFIIHADSTEYDSASIHIYDGPLFINISSVFVILRNYSYDTYRGFYCENLSNIALARLNNNDALVDVIISFIDIHQEWTELPRWESNAGMVRLNNITDSSQVVIPNTGKLSYCAILHSQNMQYLSMVGSYYYDSPARGHVTRKNMTIFSADSIINRLNIWEFQWQFWSSDWKGFIVDNIHHDIEGDELVYGSSDSIYLYTYPSNVFVWSIHIPDSLLAVNYLFIPNPDSNTNVLIICSVNSPIYHYIFIDGATGMFRYILPVDNLLLNGTVGIINTNTYILYSIRTDSIFFYSLAPRIGIDNPNLAPSAFYISRNYPNPFNASTMIEYGLPESGPVKVEIFDILGSKVQTLVDETQAAGYHRVIWNGEDSPSGTYFYRIQAGEMSQTKKCLLLK